MRANRGRSASHARRLVGAVVASILLLGLVPAHADTKGDIEAAKRKLADLQQQISTAEAHLADVQHQEALQRDRLTALQGEMNALAAKIDQAQNAYDATRGQMVETQQALEATRAKYATLRDRLDRRARLTYEMGPASSLGVILGSSNIGQLSDRLEFVDQLSALDGDLAVAVQNHANDLAAEKAQLEDIQARQAAALEDLGNQQTQLNAKFGEAQSIYDDLAAKAQDAADTEASLRSAANQADALISQLQKKLAAEKLAAARAAAKAAREAARKAAAEEKRREQQQQQQQGGGTTDPGGSTGGSTGGSDPGGSTGGTVDGQPFSVCPVDQPRAYGDSFGAPRYAGGYHPHAGNDILAPEGTPIRATFDGTASADPNGLGGNAVIVTGAQGWTYNTHMVSYGTLGSVSAGTIIGYVGNTGDAAGGPTHDHFEWHPNVMPSNPYRSVYGYTVIGSAIDPYPYLNQVC
ncbi:MAG TPA: peptidoglycan DD-metalloendopeptidase family protein [Actinomycetota bacterium]|nr:peptidoglycan DD-metalloendopeptidase family protein [Actinomycetota bacterium]